MFLYYIFQETDSKQTFNEHITKIIGRGNRIWAFIVRSTRFFTDTASVKHLYISLVESVLKYASTIWRPHLKVNTARLERVQHKALRHLAYLSGNPMSRFDHDYAAVGETFGLPTILSSMVASDNVLTFKIMSNGVQCSELKSLFPVNNLAGCV